MTTLTEDDRRLLGDSIERFAAQEYAFDKRHAILSGKDGYSKAVWRTLAELQLLGLGLPEGVGGIGGGVVDLGVVMGVIGRHLLMEPYLSTAVVVAPLLAELDPHSPHIDFDAIIAGERILALAHFEPELGFARAPIAMRATPTASGYTLDGVKSFILDGPVADALLVSALAPGGEIGIFQVNKDDFRASMRAFRSVDQRWVGEIVLAKVAAQRIGGAADVALEAALDRAVIAIGFEAVASMQVLIDDTASYIKQRRAFGKTLAQFQVLQHRMVDMVVLAQEVQALMEAAATAADTGAPERALLTAAAKTHLCRAVRCVAENAVQLHGGIAMTDELRVSHHFKRLMMIEALFGNADYYLDRYIDLAGLLPGSARR